MKKLNGFTLAEVLITLGVVGVISALTLPSVIKNYQKKVTVERLKSTYSILQEAIKRSEIDNGPLETWTIPVVSDGDWNNSAVQYNASKQIAQQYLLPYLQTVIQDCGISTPNKCLPTKYYYMSNSEYQLQYISRFAFILKNGVSIMLTTNSYGFSLWTFNNGKNSRMIGKDIFRIVVVINNKNSSSWERSCINKSGIYFVGQGCDRNYLKNNGTSYVCNKNQSGWLCGALIMLDGWKISDDYPW